MLELWGEEMTDRDKFEEYFAPVSESMRIHGVHIFEIMQRKDQQWQGWQAALASQQPADNGWIEWEGGECPVGKDVLTEIRLRNGGHGTGEGGYFAWSQDENEYDIIAYRVVKP